MMPVVIETYVHLGFGFSTILKVASCAFCQVYYLLQLRLCKILKVLPFEMLLNSLVFCIDRHHEHLPHGRDPNVTSCPFSH